MLVSYNNVTIISIVKYAAISFESGFTRYRPLNPANPKILKILIQIIPIHSLNSLSG